MGRISVAAAQRLILMATIHRTAVPSFGGSLSARSCIAFPSLFGRGRHPAAPGLHLPCGLFHQAIKKVLTDCFAHCWPDFCHRHLADGIALLLGEFDDLPLLVAQLLDK